MTQFADTPMILRTAGAGGFVRVNAAFREKFGYGDQDLSGKSLLDWVDPDDRDALLGVLGGQVASCRVRHRTRAGAWLPVDVRTTSSGEDVFVLGRLDDPCVWAPEHDAEDDGTVRGTLDTIARIVEDQNPGYRCSILLVEDGRFVRGAGPSLPEDYNAAIDGFAIGPFVGSCGTAIYWNVPVVVNDIQRDPLWAPLAKLAREAGVAACWSHPFTTKSGRVLGALALYSPHPRVPTAEQLSRLRAAARMTGLAVERGRAEEALREKRQRELELEAQLRQAAKMEALGVLAGGIAHDFNNVLATILANAEFALKLNCCNADATEMLTDICDASQRAGDFCQQLLAYAGKGTVGTQKVDLGTLLPQVRSLVQAGLSKKTSLEYALHDAAIYVEADENQLLQVILNLVTNAADAIGDGAGRIVVGSELIDCDAETLERCAPGDHLPPGQYVRVSVTDDGEGMDAATVERIFDPFFSTKTSGHGLGLAAVKGVVRSHGGVIAVDSTPGHGTKIEVLLPTTSGPPRDEEAPERAPQPEASKRVLVADDEDSYRAILRRLLAHSGFEVVAAADGQAAIEAFREDPGRFDCVLLDLSMPKLSGTEVFTELRTIRSDIPVVLMSGYNGDQISAQIEGEVVAVLQKPVPADDLVDTLARAIGE